MPVKVNLRHLEENSVQLKGELSPEELEIEHPDELVHINEPLQYDVEVERANNTLLVHGSITQVVDCECSRCLKPYREEIDLTPWEAIIPLEGEDR
ncbi:MAG: hypothetical protein JWM99_3040, partial [Verrucomicrobiales bacterium]|nr:hypothetical protein [Verrucomicrobiales bacterium]